MSIAEWRGRLGIVGHLGLYREQMMPAESELLEVADHFKLNYVVVEKRFGNAVWNLPLVYRNQHFELYRIEPPD